MPQASVRRRMDPDPDNKPNKTTRQEAINMNLRAPAQLGKEQREPDEEMVDDNISRNELPPDSPKSRLVSRPDSSNQVPGTPKINEELQGETGVLEDVGEDSLSGAIYAYLLAVPVAVLGACIHLSWIRIAALALSSILSLIVFYIHRRRALERASIHPKTGRGWVTRSRNQSVPDTTQLPAVYFLYVLGSGGHTTEMLETIKGQFQGQSNQHRRYVITWGDKDSLNRVTALESTISWALRDERAGTRDIFTIPRARKVHQPLWTAPFTCLVTAFIAISALIREPNARPFSKFGKAFKYPHVVVTNGPATGFIVCLVAHLLKIFYLAPPDRLKMVYIESWARTRTLSLTGKLFWWTGIADMFCVQHEALAEAKAGAVYVGELAAMAAPRG